MAKEKTNIQTNEGGLASESDAAAMNPEAASAGNGGMNPEVASAEVITMNPEAASVQVMIPSSNPETEPQHVADIQAQQVNVMTAPVTLIQSTPSVVATPPLPQGTSEAGKYEEFLLMPDASWPPPIFIRKSVSAQERFYISNRWHSQWNFYDKKANQSKNKYFLIQRIVVIGSLVIPALVSLNSTISRFLAAIWANGDQVAESMIRIGVDTITVIISLSVAGAAAIESLYKYGDNWSSYRSAAEELQAEKYFYDMLAGPYANNANPFATFVERTEGIVANQNGKYFQVVQQQIQKQATQNEELVDRYQTGSDKDSEEVPGAG